jgi:ABC-type methionine transport system ATPase subunit
MAKAQLHLTFPEHQLREPIVYRVGMDFGVATNIRRANVDDRVAWIIIDVEGDPDAIDRAVAWLRSEDVKVDPIPIDG